MLLFALGSTTCMDNRQYSRVQGSNEALKRRLLTSVGTAAIVGVITGIESGPLVGLGFAVAGFIFGYVIAPWTERLALDKSRMPPSDLVRTSTEGLPDERMPTRRESIGFFLMLFPRGLAIWLVWPAAFVIWTVRLPVRTTGRPRLRIRQVAGWLDRNVIAFLESTVLRPFFPRPTSFASWSHAHDVERGPSFFMGAW